MRYFFYFLIISLLSLFNNLKRAQTEYGDENPACFVGTFNAIVGVLSDVHDDVRIVTGSYGIVPAATARAVVFVKQKLLEQDVASQRGILSSWVKMTVMQ